MIDWQLVLGKEDNASVVRIRCALEVDMTMAAEGPGCILTQTNKSLTRRCWYLSGARQQSSDQICRGRRKQAEDLTGFEGNKRCRVGSPRARGEELVDRLMMKGNGISGPTKVVRWRALSSKALLSSISADGSPTALRRKRTRAAFWESRSRA